jgi:hypothetical protein
MVMKLMQRKWSELLTLNSTFYRKHYPYSNFSLDRLCWVKKDSKGRVMPKALKNLSTATGFDSNSIILDDNPQMWNLDHQPYVISSKKFMPFYHDEENIFRGIFTNPALVITLYRWKL